MKTIQLSKYKGAKFSGLVALVDDEDYNRLNQYTWTAFKNCNNIYAKTVMVIADKKCHILMHREIMNCIKGDNIKIDHKNHNGLDCQKSNMRKASNSQNGANRRATGLSKYLGVSRFKSISKSTSKKTGITKIWSKFYWGSSIRKDGKLRRIGSFKTEEDAARAYNAVAKEVHGDFANLNIL